MQVFQKTGLMLWSTNKMIPQFKTTCCGHVVRSEECSKPCPKCGTEDFICEEVPKRERVFMNPPLYSGDKRYEEREWGSFEVLLDEPKLKIKKIIVKNGKRLSLQLHELRDERWFIAGGCGEVQIGNETIDISEGDELFIGKYQVHRVRSAGLLDLVIIEIQTGVCNEDDIIRIEDDYGRA
tara:strand:- start:372 stop:914 length:543 start_codon:yes stop_codon:yes gene_type:complete